MILGNYEKILKVISKSSGLTEDEISKKVEEKRNKLSGLISKEGAAQVIAAELGISFDNEKLKINEILPEMKRVNTFGKVLDISPVRTFNRNGNEGKVANLRIADDTSNIKVVLWDVQHISLIENGEIGIGKVVEVSNGSMRDGEIHLGSFSEIKLSGEDLGDVVEKKIVQSKNIKDVKISDSVNLRAFVVQVFDPRFFFVCPECKKKANAEGDGHVCGEHGKVVAEKRALMNLVLDDGTETLRAVVFNDLLPSLGIVSLEDSSMLVQERENLLGEEFVFYGNVRKNSFFDNIEFTINGVKPLNVDELLTQMENAQ